MQLAYNYSTRKDKVRYIVIHDTGNTRTGADAMSNFCYFNKKETEASADFIVDDKGALQINDYTKFYTWHCGDGKGKYGITNANSIGIEICINRDGDYETAFKHAVSLTKDLMQKLDIDIDHVVRHYDASRKLCPQSMAGDNWARWQEFKQKLLEDEKVIYNYIDESMPAWARPTIEKLVRKGFLKGNEKGELGLDETMLRILVIHDRAGVYGE